LRCQAKERTGAIKKFSRSSIKNKSNVGCANFQLRVSLDSIAYRGENSSSNRVRSCSYLPFHAVLEPNVVPPPFRGPGMLQSLPL
jgi:hypothetical protein